MMTNSFSYFQRIITSENVIRRALMVILAFFMTHLITYQKLPFTDDYQFPLIPFTVFVIYGIFICEANTWNYKRLSLKNSRHLNLKTVWRIIRVNLIACTIIFALLTSLQMLVFQFIMNPFRFVGLLSVCFMISIIETSVFIFRGYSNRRQPITLNKIASSTNVFTIVRNDELIKFDEAEVAYLIHRDGCVFLINQQGERFTTQFDTLSEIESRVSSQFFRANRQLLISRLSIRSFQKDVNNKLKVQLHHLEEPIIVSRYKSRELKEWFKS